MRQNRAHFHMSFLGILGPVCYLGGGGGCFKMNIFNIHDLRFPNGAFGEHLAET